MNLKKPTIGQFVMAGMVISASSLALAEIHLPNLLHKEPTAQELQQKEITNKVVAQVREKLGSINEQAPALRTDLGEHMLPGEEEAIDQATEDVVKTIMNRAFTGKTNGIAKGDHGKTQACLNGTIQFFDDIPEHLQRGVVVPGAQYKVFGRLSNAEEPTKSDRASTSQGVALKLKSVSSIAKDQARLPDFAKSDEQDFLMTSAPTFFVKDILDYVVAFNLRNGEATPLSFAKALVNKPILFGRVLTEGQALLNDLTALAPGNPENILTHPYWSKHPYAWGTASEKSSAVKYGVAPCENIDALTRASDAKEYQKDFISEGFSMNREICFYFQVQARPQGATEQGFPIENAKVEWLEQQAPFVKIAKVVFKASENKNWMSKEAQDACQMTEFSPWNGLTAHQPMSNLARGRRFVYKASALVREVKSQLDSSIKSAK